MKLLLQACCADCTIKFIESTKSEIEAGEITIYYFNPNIHPRSEYQSRLKAMQMITEKYGIKMIVPDWKPGDYFKRINPLSSDESQSTSPPAGRHGLNRAFNTIKNRCEECWDLRIEKSVEYAKNNEFDSFSTTLLSSDYQNTKKIEEIVKEKCKEKDIKSFIPNIIDKTIETAGFYKQFFCGCVYSMKERMEEKYTSTNKFNVNFEVLDRS